MYMIMEREYIIIISLALIIVCLLYINYTQKPVTPSERSRIEESKIIPAIDIEFSEQNFPSVVYSDLFSGPNVWQGGYNLDQSRAGTSSAQTGVATRPVTTVTGFVKSG